MVVVNGNEWMGFVVMMAADHSSSSRIPIPLVPAATVDVSLPFSLGTCSDYWSWGDDYCNPALILGFTCSQSTHWPLCSVYICTDEKVKHKVFVSCLLHHRSPRFISTGWKKFNWIGIKFCIKYPPSTDRAVHLYWPKYTECVIGGERMAFVHIDCKNIIAKWKDFVVKLIDSQYSDESNQTIGVQVP